VRALRPEPRRGADALGLSTDVAFESGLEDPGEGNAPAMAVGQVDGIAGQVDGIALEPVVILGLLNSMAVVIANAETLLSSWDALSSEGETARVMLQRLAAHARVVTDALELAAREVSPTVIEGMQRPA
jgi:hypothetical protein